MTLLQILIIPSLSSEPMPLGELNWESGRPLLPSSSEEYSTSSATMSNYIFRSKMPKAGEQVAWHEATSSGIVGRRRDKPGGRSVGRGRSRSSSSFPGFVSSGGWPGSINGGDKGANILMQRVFCLYETKCIKVYISETCLEEN